jgi:hypothetical protein
MTGARRLDECGMIVDPQVASEPDDRWAERLRGIDYTRQTFYMLPASRVMTMDDGSTRRFPIEVGRKSRWLLRLFGVSDSNAYVDVGPASLDARFGFGRLRTPIENVAAWRIEGPWRWITAIGIRRNWLKSDLAFDGVHHGGVKLEFREPARSFGLKVTALYVTVADIDGFTAALRARGIDGIDARRSG